MAPLHSKLLLFVIDRRNIFPASASIASSDVFLVARRVKEFRTSSHPSSAMQQQLPKFTPNDVLPVRLMNPEASHNLHPGTSVRHIRLENSIMQASNRLGLNDLSYVYGEFLNHLWEIWRKELGWKDQVMYMKMTLPWLQGIIVLLHGSNHPYSIPFQHSSLLRKSDLEERGQKIVGSDILVDFEKGISSSLRWCLRQKGVHIDCERKTVNMHQ